MKPDIIWLGMTGFGPDSNEAAYDPILQARSGLMELTGEAKGDPQVMGIPLPDMGTSVHGYGAVMKALFKRQATGEGSCIHLSMFESSVSWLTVPITISTTFKKEDHPKGKHPRVLLPCVRVQTPATALSMWRWETTGSGSPWFPKPMFKSLGQTGV